jgi:hypothetical protein
MTSFSLAELIDGASCAVYGCEREPRGNRRHCALHEKRRQRGASLNTSPKSERLAPWPRLVESAIALADALASSDAERIRRRKECARKAGMRWARAEAASRGHGDT